MQIISSAENPMFRREKFMAVVPSKEYGGTAWIDPLDPRILTLVKKATVAGQIEYRGQPATSISFQAYKNTTLYWLILMFNGYLFAEDIPYGTKLKIPDISSITKDLRPGQPVKNRQGTVVRT